MWPFKKKDKPKYVVLPKGSMYSNHGMTVGDIWSFEPENPYGHDCDIEIVSIRGDYCQWRYVGLDKLHAEKISTTQRYRGKREVA
jgi:hypothetical protein